MLNYEALKKRRAGSRNTGWKPKDGSNKIRILPPRSIYLQNWEAMEDLAIGFNMHFFRIEGRPMEVSRCLEELKQKCPACDAWRVHRKTEDPGFKELAKSIGPARQYLFNILDINNLQAGIQAWSANYTCWDKILEIAANPAWGNVVDPANGVNFDVNLTPGSRSRTGYNTYSVTPEPQRTTVMGVLESIADWQAALDSLEAQICEAKTAEEITALLTEMGLALGAPSTHPAAVAVPRPAAAPTPAVAAVVPPGVTPVAPAPVAPALAAPVPVAPMTATPVPSAAPAPAPVAPVAPATAPVSVPPAAVTAPAAPAAVAAPAAPAAVAAPTTGPHYDPGPNYTPKLRDDERPAGAPRCFGDYNPQVHRCQGCPQLTDCQLRLLGVE